MNGVRLFRSEATPSAIAGRVLARDVRDGAGCIALGKGTILDEGSLAAILPLAWEELHLVDPAPDDVHEHEAGGRLARAAMRTCSFAHSVRSTGLPWSWVGAKASNNSS